MAKMKRKYNKGSVKRLKNKLLEAGQARPMNRTNKEMSSLEIIVFNILTELEITFEREKPLKYKLGYRYFDFYLPDQKILIEVDSDYYHGERNKPDYTAMMAKKNDMAKNWVAKKEGLTLIRIKEKQLKESKEIIKNDIANLIKENSWHLDNKCVYYYVD